MTPSTYSIAIRTLGTAGEKFRKELESACVQTVRSERVVIYIAEGQKRPDSSVGEEEYVWVPKAMMSQRVLLYDEITCVCILMPDDDVLLPPEEKRKGHGFYYINLKQRLSKEEILSQYRSTLAEEKPLSIPTIIDELKHRSKGWKVSADEDCLLPQLDCTRPGG